MLEEIKSYDQEARIENIMKPNANDVFKDFKQTVYPAIKERFFPKNKKTRVFAPENISDKKQKEIDEMQTRHYNAFGEACAKHLFEFVI